MTFTTAELAVISLALREYLAFLDSGIADYRGAKGEAFSKEAIEANALYSRIEAERGIAE
jgi:hypothetical protein